MSLRGLVAGALFLVGLDAVVSSQAAASRFGGLVTALGTITRRVLSPGIAAIPDLSNS